MNSVDICSIYPFDGMLFFIEFLLVFKRGLRNMRGGIILATGGMLQWFDEFSSILLATHFRPRNVFGHVLLTALLLATPSFRPAYYFVSYFFRNDAFSSVSRAKSTCRPPLFGSVNGGIFGFLRSTFKILTSNKKNFNK